MTCTNCGAELLGDFCHKCGQAAANPLLTTAAFVADASGEIFQLHSRTVRSLTGLCRPGFLTNEYIAGRRIRYLAPVQLYLICAALFFLLNNVRPVVRFSPETRQVSTSLGLMGAGGGLDSAQTKQLAARGVDVRLFEERFANHVNANLPIFLILSVVLFAILLRIIFFWHRFGLAENTVFALHWSAFFLLAMMVDLMLPVSRGVFSIAHSVVTALTFVYMLVAVHRVYRLKILAGGPMGVVVFLLFNVILGVWVISVISIAFGRI